MTLGMNTDVNNGDKDSTVNDVDAGDAQSINRTVGVVYSPKSGRLIGGIRRRQVLDRLETRLSDYGMSMLDLTGDSRDGTIGNIRNSITSLAALVVIGGDGMVNLGVNAIGNSGLPLGIIATGSGNDFARGMSLPVNKPKTSVEGIVAGLVRGSHIMLDCGVVFCTPENGGCEYSAGTRFVGSLSCAVDAAISNRANHLHIPNGSLRYLSAGLAEIAGLEDYRFRLSTVDSGGNMLTRNVSTSLLLFANSRFVGGGMECSPNSRLDDGLLDMVMSVNAGKLDLVDSLWRSYHGGSHIGKPTIEWKQVVSAMISTDDERTGNLVLQADGEDMGRLPATVSVDRVPYVFLFLLLFRIGGSIRNQTTDIVENNGLPDLKDPAV